MKTWNATRNDPDDALNLLAGQYCAHYGVWVHQKITAEDLISAANIIKAKELDQDFDTQAAIIVEAKRLSERFKPDGVFKLV